MFRLHQALTRGFGPSDFAGLIPTGEAPVGLAFSPSGRWLYSTSELAVPAAGGQGTLSVISVPRAESDPARSVVTTVHAGCSPVRVITSADGAVVWVTARESDALLAFSAARLLSDPARARLADVQVGEAPVGLTLVDGGRRLVAADSDRFSLRGAQANLAVVSVAAALAHRPPCSVTSSPACSRARWRWSRAAGRCWSPTSPRTSWRRLAWPGCPEPG